MNPPGANDSEIHPSFGPSLLNSLQRYGLAVFSVAVALGASLLLQHFHFRVPAALLLLCAVAVSSWYTGLGPAVLAGTLSIIGFYWYFVEPVRTIYIFATDVPYFLIVAAFAALLSWFGTVRRRGEADLREQAALLNLTHDTVFVMDMEGVIKYWNRGAEERYGWTADQAVGKVVHDLLKTVFPKPLDEIKPELTRTGRWEGELLHTKKDGTQLVAASRWSLKRGKRGESVAILETNNDITERKRTEQALRESETRFRTFVDHAADAFFMMDCERKTITDVNQAASQGLGYTRQELIGNTPLAFHLDSQQAEVEAHEERATAGETVIDRHLHRRKDGSTFPVEVHLSQVLYQGRRFLLKVARDITYRVRAEEQREQLRQLEAELAHLDRLTTLGELTASIAHEVNQPLSGVVSNGSACLRWLAAETPNLDEAREAARRIVRDGKRAAEVIARVRALTKKSGARKEKLDLNQTIREVLALVGDEAKKNSVLIRTEFADDSFAVLGDRVQLQQVLLNLVMNATEAMIPVRERARELVITTRNIDTDELQVTVADSGVGLDANMVQKIFEPFYTTKSTGMGMGLSVSRSIVQSHGGRLWATAKDSPGATFYFTVPKYKEEAHEEEANARFAKT